MVEKVIVVYTFKQQFRVQLYGSITKSNYFAGGYPKQWITDVTNYAKVKYEQVYPGIDLIFYGNPQQLEYDFVVAPGADPKQIRLSFDGIQRMKIDENGELVLATKAGEARQRKPLIYQLVNGERQEVIGRYVRFAKEQIGFEVDSYDPGKALVIDPVFAYATFFGTSPGVAIAVDKDGNAYVAGQVPPTPGAFQGIGSYRTVTKLNASGTAVIYSAAISGNQDDRINDIAVDAVGNAFITGRTESPNFPTTPGAFQSSFGRIADNNHNAYVLKLNETGSALVYSTFLKGDLTDPITELKLNEGMAIDIDAQGNAYVTGRTNATDFPVTPGAFQQTISTYPRSSGRHFPPNDAFVTKLNATGTGIIYSTFLGSAANTTEEGKDIEVDGAGNAYVTGGTSNGRVDVRLPPGAPFPVTTGAYQTTDTFGSSGTFIVNYAFVTKLNSTGTALIYSTLIGSSPVGSEPVKLGIDSSGNAYISGYTTSTTFPTTAGAYKRTGGGQSTMFPGDDNPDCFITKLNASGSVLVYSTYFGGNYVDRCFGLAVDGEGSVHVTGLTLSSDFPQIGLPPQTIGIGEDSGGFVTKLNATGTGLIQSISIKIGRIQAIDLDNAGNAYVTGSGRIQPTPNAYQSNEGDGMVAKITSPRSFLTVSAADYTPNLATETIVAAFGLGLATTTQIAASTPLPTNLAGTIIKVRDSLGVEREAPLFFVSPTQVNYLIPAGTATGLATVNVSGGDGARSIAQVQINSVAPGLFTADASGRGIPAAVALRVKADGAQSFEPVARFDPVLSRIVAVPIDLGAASDQVFLILNGTGIRFRSNLSAVSARVGGTDTPVLFAGAQGNFVGLDQINLLLPRTLIGRGDADVTLTVDGKTANIVRINIK